MTMEEERGRGGPGPPHPLQWAQRGGEEEVVPEPGVQAEVAAVGEEGRREQQVGQAGREGGRWGALLLAEGQVATMVRGGHRHCCCPRTGSRRSPSSQAGV